VSDFFKILLVKKEKDKKIGFNYFLLIVPAGILVSSWKAYEFHKLHTLYDFPIFGVLNVIPFLIYFRALLMIPKNIFLEILGMLLLVIVVEIPWTWDAERSQIWEAFLSLPLSVFVVNFALSLSGLIFALFIRGKNRKQPRTAEGFNID